jgi:hypothetical protein
MVIPSLLYSCETSTRKVEQAGRTEAEEMRFFEMVCQLTRFEVGDEVKKSE